MEPWPCAVAAGSCSDREGCRSVGDEHGRGCVTSDYKPCGLTHVRSLTFVEVRSLTQVALG